MGLPFTGQHMAIRRGVALREITCESCGTSFVYALAREGVGHGTSFLLLNRGGADQHASDEAASALAKHLRDDVDPLPCPKCGRYQQSMIPVIRRGLYWWMYGVAGACFLAGFVSLLVIPTMLANAEAGDGTKNKIVLILVGAATATVCGFGLLKIRKSRCEAFEPNTQDLRTLMRLQRHRTMLKEDFEREGAGKLLDPVNEKYAKAEWGDSLFTLGLRFALAAAFFGIGVTFMIWIWQEIFDGLASPNWPTVEGQVDFGNVEITSSKENAMVVYHYLPVVNYTYRVNGVEYTGDRYRFAPTRFLDSRKAHAILAEYPAGQHVRVHVKPSDPGESVLVPGLPQWRVWFFAGLAATALVSLAVGAHTTHTYRRLRRQRNA